MFKLRNKTVGAYWHTPNGGTRIYVLLLLAANMQLYVCRWALLDKENQITISDLINLTKSS